MSALQQRPIDPSVEMSDLDGYSIPSDHGYSMTSHFSAGSEDFGFDPPSSQGFPKAEPFSPPTLADPLQLSSWPVFEGAESKDPLLANHLPSPSDTSVQNFELDRMLNQALPNPATAIARFGQVTPPRSSSATSEIVSEHADTASPKENASERRKRNSKAAVKDELETAQPVATGRKRKNTRKSSTAKEEQDDKRKQSLEKNRLAAAKCRVNKKEKTEQLQRNSHEKAVHNAFLKEQVMRMKEEVQQMNALLLAHANCDGCKSPDEIQKHLSNLGNEFFANHMSSLNYEYPHVGLEDLSPMQSEYFTTASAGATMLNPPLPEFDRTAEFECHTPMQTD